MKKALQIPHLRASNTVSDEAASRGLRDASRGSPRPLWRRARGAPRPRSPTAHSAACARCSRVAGGGPCRGRRSGFGTRLGQRPRDELQGRASPAGARRSRPRAAPSSKPQIASACGRSACRRAGSAQARRCGRSRRRPRPARPPQPPPCPRSGRGVASSRLELVTERFDRAPPRGHLEQLVGLGGQHRRIGRGDERLAGARDPGREDPAAVRVELREDVVEQEQRREAAALGDQLRLGEEEREHREPLLALRAEAPQLPRRRRRRRRRRDAGRGRSRRGRGRGRAAPRARRPSAARRRSAAPRPARPSSPARSANGGPSSASVSLRAATSSVPSAATCSVHGASASRVEKPPATRRSDALRCATAAPYSAESCARGRARGGRARGRSTRGAPRARPSRRRAGPA